MEFGEIIFDEVTATSGKGIYDGREFVVSCSDDESTVDGDFNAAEQLFIFTQWEITQPNWVTVLKHQGFKIQTKSPAKSDELHYIIAGPAFAGQRFDLIQQAVDAIDKNNAKINQKDGVFVMNEKVNGIPRNVIDVLAPLRTKHDFLELENPAVLFYRLRAAGHHDVVKYLSDDAGELDQNKWELVVVEIMRKLRNGRI